MSRRSRGRWGSAACAVLVLLAGCDTGVEPVPTRPNPLAGVTLYVPVPSAAAAQVEAWRETRPEDATALERIARESRGVWLADGDPLPELGHALEGAAATGTVPVLVAYYIPDRDCGAGGAADPAEYRTWIRAVADALEGRESIVVVEPDALGHLECGPVNRSERLASLRDAVATLKSAGAVVYLDAGHPRWLTAAEAAERLLDAGVRDADGFSLNVANFVWTDETVAYGHDLLESVGPTGFVIDTSRNGVGPDPEGAWCNPAGRKLGAPPTTDPPYAGVDALLWIKRPGESDGPCNGGPPAGEWWPEYALMLAR